MRRLISLLVVFAALTAAGAEEVWRTVLRQMPLRCEAGSLARSNCFPALLAAFQSNHLVKALVVLPGAADDFYLINRDQPLRLTATNLTELLYELSQATAVHITWREPLLLLHTAKDKLKPEVSSLNRSVTKRLQAQCSAPSVNLVDRRWDKVQPWLMQSLRVKVVPEADSIEAWHFARHHFAAWGLSDWDLLGALSLSGGTRITVGGERLLFEQRGTPPKRRPFIPPASF